MSKVSIILATYNPNLNWFEKQLESINNQTYIDIEVLVCDDSSPNVDFKLITEIVNRKIINFPVSIYQNKFNIGCTKTFSDLVTRAKGDYISFCDQDDIWEINKISKLVNSIENTDYVLAYCRASVIDENDNVIVENWDNIRKFANVGKGNKKYNSLLFRTWIAGCFMLVKTDTVKKAYPFSEHTIYDHWIALISSLEGEFIHVNEPLIRYRRHQNTQTGSLVKVNSKNDYKSQYIDGGYGFIKDVNKRLINSKIDKSLKQALLWCNYRIQWWEHLNLIAMIGLFKGFKFDKKIVVFELFSARMSEKLFKKIVRYIKGRK